MKLLHAPDEVGWTLVGLALLWAWLGREPVGPTSGEWQPEMTGVEYEEACAATLRASGWKARMTPGSTDHGVDIVAEKNGVRVAIQCKRYSKMVGNRAVQEALAGREHTRARYGVVVSNASYTSAARALAASTGIKLLHHGDLRRFDKLFRVPG